MKKTSKMDIILKVFRNSDVTKTKEKIKMLGPSAKYDTTTFIFLRIALSLVVFFLTIYFFKFGYIVAPFIAILCYYLFFIHRK